MNKDVRREWEDIIAPNLPGLTIIDSFVYEKMNGGTGVHIEFEGAGLDIGTDDRGNVSFNYPLVWKETNK